MEENMNVTTEMAEQVVEAAQEAVAKVAENLPATTGAKTSRGIGKDLAIGGAGLVGGFLIKMGFDKWVAPRIDEARKNHKAKKAQKKAEKEAKKGAFGKAEATEKKAEPVVADEGIDPRGIDTKID